MTDALPPSPRHFPRLAARLRALAERVEDAATGPTEEEMT